MRFAIRAAALAVIASLTAGVVLFPPGVAPVAAAAQPAADADLALVPADAVGFIRVRAADLWNSDLLATYRQTFAKAGPKALAALDAQFVPKISTFDRVTAFLLLDAENKEPVPVVVLRFSAPFDQDEVLKAYVPNAEKSEIGGKTIFGSQASDFEMYFPSKQILVFGPPGSLTRYLKHDFPKTGAMSYGLKLAASGKTVVGSVNLAALPIPPKFLEEVPAEARPLLRAEHLTGSADITSGIKLDFTAGYKNAEDAQAAEKAVKVLAEMGRKELAKVREDFEKRFLGAKGPRPPHDLPEALLSVFAIGALNQVDDLLAKPEEFVKRNGANLTATLTLPKELVAAAGSIAAVGAGFLLPAVQKVRSAAARMSSLNNMKQIMLACHAYHDVYGHLPNDITDKNGKPLLSWRVAILPFIEQNNLYSQFKLDEPWDSKNNKQWSQVAVKTYLSPLAVTPNPAGLTHYQGFVGPGTMFEAGKKIKLTDVFDGTSNPIMFVETADAVEWTKPGGIPFDPKKPLPKLPSAGGNDLILAALCDGSVRTLNMKTLTEKTLKYAIQRDDGNPLGSDW
jgi:Protein of unknown function (DUF1559)